MSAGSVFRLSANEGKSDQLLTATDWLNRRISFIQNQREAEGAQDTLPTLAEIEQTHIIYMHAQFKPFASIGFEYSKVRPNTGTPSFGSGVQFDIPVFGDFFHDMVCRVRTSAARAKVLTAPEAGTDLFPSNVEDDGEGGTYYSLVDAQGNAVAAGTQYRNYVRYCEYPANRLCTSVNFQVNGNPLDSYTENVPLMLDKFRVGVNKRGSYDVLCGQEVPLEGYGGVRNATVTDADSVNTPSGISRSVAGQSNQTVALFDSSEMVDADQLVKLNAVENQVDVSRKMFQVVNGPQTPKPIQPPLEMWHRLRFWFCDDVRLSIPSVSIPYGNRWISMEFNQLKNIIYESPSLFLRTAQTGASRSITYSPINQLGGIEPVTFEAVELYINNIFVNREIHDIFINRVGFTLVRVFREQNTSLTSASGEVLLSSLKWPVEYMMVGVRPDWNVKDTTVSGGVVEGNQNQWRDWHRLTRMVDATDDQQSLSEVGTGEDADTSSSVGQVMPDRYYLPVPTVDTLGVNSHGNRIFDEFSDTFYNLYAPFQYGGQNINAPNDVGALFVNLCLYPGSYQPSGSLNFSRARETNIKYVSSYVSSSTPAHLIVVAIALNFLLISNGSAVLRYAT